MRRKAQTTMEELWLVTTTLPDEATASTLAHALVEQRLAACVQLLPGVRSVYRWQGVVEEAQEVLLVIKTVAARYPALEEAIRMAHPYAVPEIVAVPAVRGLPAYLQWVNDETK